MSDLRVLHVINELGTGGAESLVIEMVKRGGDVGWRSAVASSGGCRVEELAQAEVPHFHVTMARRTARSVLGAQKATVRALRSFQPDIVIAHNVSATLVTRLAHPRAPVLTIFHGVSASDYRNAARILNFASDRVVAVSDAIRNRLKSAGLRRVKVTTIRNAVTPSAPQSQAASRAALNLPLDVPVALCLARMEPQKRHDVLLDAWSRLSGHEILLLAGDGSLRTELERGAGSLGDRVRFLGNRTDVSTLLAASDVTVLTSDWEGLPMAILESLAAGRPVVATDVDGVREILAPGGGRLVPPGDANSVAGALRELLSDEVARRAEASVGLATVRESYDAARMMKLYDGLVREMGTKEHRNGHR